MTLAKKTKRAKHKKAAKMNPRAFRRLVKAVLALGLAGGLAALSLTVLFPVRRCTAEGATRYSANQFAEAMGVGKEEMNLFTAETAALAEKVHAALPYARVVRISRRLPGTLHLTVEERAPAFAQQQDKLWWLLTEDGRLLGTETPMPEGLMPITGAALLEPVAGQQAAWKNAFTAPSDIAALLACLRASSLWPGVTGLRVSTAATPDAIYQDRIRIRFGTATPSASAGQEAMLAEKLRMAEEVIAQKDAQNPLQRGILDLSTYGKAYFTADWD
jgi:cell division septal protein FtsQ